MPGPKLRYFAYKHGQYWYVSPRPQKWVALGSSFERALLEWSHLTGVAPPGELKLFSAVAGEYLREVVSKKAPKTAAEQRRQMGLLLEVFGQLSIEQIKPQDVRRYLHMRGAHPVAANREIALLSHIFNKARNWGYLEIANPCTGIERYRESGRDKYVTDEEYDALYRHADPLLRDAMDLAYFTAQRVADVLKMKVADVRDGYIWIAQNKTKAKLRVELVGDLAAVIERIMRRKADSKVTLLRKPEDEQLLASGGVRVSYDLLRWRFTRARKLAGVDFQFRDLRAKAATDIDNLDRAQRLLGHSTRTMTEHYTKNRAGEKVVPLLHFPGRKVIDKKAD